jgi:hypothetical protein
MSLPVPGVVELADLTDQVARNNNFAAVEQGSFSFGPVMDLLRQQIQHVIYIIKENRTYDQVLGDLPVGNGDPSIVEFPQALTPNHHALALNFVTLDNFFDSGEVSGVGWNWSTAARTTDYTEKTVPPEYANRGLTYDWEGTNRNVNVAQAAIAAMQMSDNDYAVGLLVQKVAASPYAGNTLIFILEDDAQDGPDHVDAHRSIAYVVGPYVKQGAVVSERYTTVRMVRTMEVILGLSPSSLYSAAAAPMTEVFDPYQTAWTYNALVPGLLGSSQVPVPQALQHRG